MAKSVTLNQFQSEQGQLRKVIDYDRMIELFEFLERDKPEVLKELRNSGRWQGVEEDYNGNIFVTKLGDWWREISLKF